MEETFKVCRILNCTNYEVSDLGTVRNISTGKILSNKQHKRKGYVHVTLVNDYGERISMQVGRLVLMVWRPDADMFDKDCNHISGDKSDNSLENLEWLKHSDNILAIKERQRRIDFKHTRGIFIVYDDPEDESNKIVKYYRRMSDADIPYETVRHMIRYGYYSEKHKCRCYYQEELPEEYEIYIKVNRLF